MTNPKGSLLDEIKAQQRGTGSTCAVAAVLAQLDPDDRADVIAAVNDGVPAAAISRALDRRGVRLSAGSLQRHNRGDCLCGRAR